MDTIITMITVCGSQDLNGKVAEPAKEIGPVPLVPKSRVKALQNARYTSFGRLQKAKSLDEVF